MADPVHGGKRAFEKIAGRTIEGLVVRRSNGRVGPRYQLFFCFKDGEALEIFGDDVEIAETTRLPTSWVREVGNGDHVEIYASHGDDSGRRA